MKKFNFLFGAFALAAMVSCSSDEVVSSQNDVASLSKQSISFAPLASKTTRSTVYSPTAMFTNFRVIGRWHDNAPTEVYIEGNKWTVGTTGNYTWSTAPTAGKLYQEFDAGDTGKKGLEIVKNGTGWDYKDQSKIQYWPYQAVGSDPITGYTCLPLDFRAVAPANEKLDLEGSNMVYSTPAAVADQVDICYAEANSKTVADAPVQMAFHHLFSQVIFKAKKASNYTVDIKDITIGGVGTEITGGYPFNSIQKTTNICLNGGQDGEGATITNPKSFPGFTSASYTSVPDQADSESAAQMTPAGQELILIPQLIEKWEAGTTTGDSKKAGDSGKGYVKITYRAKTKDAATWATSTSGDGFKEVYFPLQAKWYSGKKYIYTFLFGSVTDPDDPGTDDPNNPDPGTGGDNPGGYNEEGTPEAPSVPITFTASVGDWTEQVVDIDM